MQRPFVCLLQQVSTHRSSSSSSSSSNNNTMPDTVFTRPDGKTTGCYLAEPSGPVKGNIIVVQEWWGLNAHIRSICDTFASHGYRALAPDLYHGVVATTRDEASHNMSKLNWQDAITQDMAGAISFLRSKGGKVACTGFCMGGAVTLAAAVNLPLDAAIPFYGIPPPTAGDLGTIRCPVQAHFAEHDDWCTPDKVDELEKKLIAGGVKLTLYRYDAHHAFMNKTRPEVYSEPHAKLAYERVFAFLQQHVAA